MNFIDPATGDPYVTPCQKVDPELFFSNDDSDQAHAKELCRSCPIAAQKACLETAMHDEATRGFGYRYGIRAGLMPYERSRMADRTVAA